jgi:hypothetical protein
VAGFFLSLRAIALKFAFHPPEGPIIWQEGMERRSDSIVESHQESSEKFDYFMSGVTGALFAYLGQALDYSSHWIAFWTGMATLGALAVSFYYGLKRIELAVTLKGGDIRTNRANEDIQYLTERMFKKEMIFRGGERITEEMACQIVDDARQEISQTNKTLKVWGDIALKLYRKRNLWLFIGFGLLISERILKFVLS